MKQPTTIVLAVIIAFVSLPPRGSPSSSGRAAPCSSMRVFDRAVRGSLPDQNIVWSEPTDITSRNLFFGNGGSDNAPNPAHRFTFLQGHDEATGEKRALDEAGRTWRVTTGDHARAETAASRLVWAAGYHVDQIYLLTTLRIGGNGGGDFTNVRLTRVDDGFTHEGNWDWSSNPFVGTQPFQGLRVLMALLSNWKLPSKNNRRARRGDVIRFYVAALGSTLGKSATLASNSSSGNAKDYSEQKFIDKVENGKVFFHLKGDFSSVVRPVSVADAKWLGGILTRLSDQQLSDAFKAGGFNPGEVELFRQAVRKRIAELLAL